jgi:hypothetical protein
MVSLPSMVRSESRWTPEYLRMECDAFGTLLSLLLAHHVSSLVERRNVWQCLIKMDSITRAIVLGNSATRARSYLPNDKRGIFTRWTW